MKNFIVIDTDYSSTIRVNVNTIKTYYIHKITKHDGDMKLVSEKIRTRIEFVNRDVLDASNTIEEIDTLINSCNQ
jgi:hypothetical protein